MFRHQYDSDNNTWSPQGRLFQIEYACESIKQGSAILGVKSATHTILCTFSRQIDELGAYQQKLYKIDDHVVCAVSGFCADARVLTSDMRSRCIDHRYIYDTPQSVEKLVKRVSSDAQEKTQISGKRPFGVGLLVAGYDQKPRLFETNPSGLYYSYKAQAIGARSQACRTYLEKRLDEFKTADVEKLIDIGVRALKESLATTNEKLHGKNCGIAIVGEEGVKIYTEEEVENVLKQLDNEMQIEQPQLD